MSLQIRIPEVVGAWLAVPKTQRNNFIHFSRLLNFRSLALNILYPQSTFSRFAIKCQVSSLPLPLTSISP